MRVLILACGNPLRQDDGAAWRLASTMDGRPHAGLDLEVIACMQYLPEMAEAVSRADGVIFIDASVAVPHGTARLSPLATDDATTAAMTHHLDPAGLVSLGRHLYGTRPRRTVQLEIGAAEFGLSERVSEPAERGIEAAGGLLRDLLVELGAPTAGGVR